MRTYTTGRVALAGTLSLILLFQPFAPWAQTTPDKSVRVAQGGRAPAGICHCCGRPTCPCKAHCCEPGNTDWLKKYDAAQDLFKASNMMTDEADKEWRKWIDELKKELPKDVAKDVAVHVVLEAGGKVAENALEAGSSWATKVLLMQVGEGGIAVPGFVIGALILAADIGYQAHVTNDQVRGMYKKAREASKAGAKLLDKIDIKADLAKDNLCDEIRRKGIDAELLRGKAHDMVKNWEANEKGTLFFNPDTKELIDEKAAVDKAVKILSSKSKQGTILPTFRFVQIRETTSPATVTATKRQVAAALVEIRRAQTLFKRGMEKVMKTTEAQQKSKRELQTLLNDFRVGPSKVSR